MRVITLDDGEAEVFARSALVLKYDEPGKTLADHGKPDPASLVVSTTTMRTCGPRSTGSRRTVKGGLSGRSANGRQQRTRPVQGIDQNVRLNRALWLLADGPAPVESLTPRIVPIAAWSAFSLGGRPIFVEQTGKAPAALCCSRSSAR